MSVTEVEVEVTVTHESGGHRNQVRVDTQRFVTFENELSNEIRSAADAAVAQAVEAVRA